ncbi:kelch-like protein 5 [Lutzomyia longipalpis]|uniref:kelch-like protein 5 n=1 Tax=Lutzomyia longipalpis TaxID=7200 RepID=UPI00248369E5|nr:kelch-like protein 5 [Lutzomyia longipalpis]
MSFSGGSPGRESTKTSVSADESILPRDFSLVSLASTSSQDENFCSREHADCTLKRMQFYLENQKLCDVVLIAGVDGKRVPAHRLVLSAASAYFAAMFTGSLRETQEREITLGEVTGTALQLLVQYCYTGTIELREDTVETLLSTASLLQLGAVVNACCTFLGRQLHPSNCLGFALFAEQQSCETLLKVATDYTCEHFMQVCRNQEFFQLSAEQLHKLLASDNLNVPSEQDVFHALLAWLQHEPKEREKDIPELLALIRLPLLQPAFIADHVEALCESTKCQELVMEALKWHLLPERRALIASQRARPRKSTMGKLLAVGGMDAHKGSISIESYCPRLDKWSLVKNMTARRLQFGVAVMDNRLIVVGGRDGLKTLNTVESLDLTTMTWSNLPPMITNRHGLCAAVLGGPLYVIGGHDGWSFLNTVERWDPSTRTWSSVAPMTTMRSTAGVAVLGGHLYVVGGRDGSGCHRSVERYDPHTNKWSLRAAMVKRRAGVGVTAANFYIYALGGHENSANNPSASRTETVERYDPGTDTWTLLASLNVGRDSIGVALLGERILAVGGYDGNQYLKTVEQYDPETNEWSQLAPLNFSRAGACVVAIPNTAAVPTTSNTKWRPVRFLPCYGRQVKIYDHYV